MYDPADWRVSADAAVALDALPPPPRWLGTDGADFFRALVAGLARERALAREDMALLVRAASAYQEAIGLDREIHRSGGLLAESEKGGKWLSGEAQARAYCERRLDRALMQLGLGSALARLKVFGAAQTDFFDRLGAVAAGPRPEADPTDPYAQFH
jgi:P27 family predicted phage terminase small subunit